MTPSLGSSGRAQQPFPWRIIEWFGLEGTFMIIQFQSPCCGRFRLNPSSWILLGMWCCLKGGSWLLQREFLFPRILHVSLFLSCHARYDHGTPAKAVALRWSKTSPARGSPKWDSPSLYLRLLCHQLVAAVLDLMFSKVWDGNSGWWWPSCGSILHL